MPASTAAPSSPASVGQAPRPRGSKPARIATAVGEGPQWVRVGGTPRYWTGPGARGWLQRHGGTVIAVGTTVRASVTGAMNLGGGRRVRNGTWPQPRGNALPGAARYASRMFHLTRLGLAVLVALILPSASLAESWKVIDIVDAYDEPVGKAAASPWTGPVRPLPFPYEDVKARVVVDLSKSSRSPRVRLSFTRLPNLALQAGYPPGRWDDDPVRFLISHQDGERSIHFGGHRKKVQRIMQHETLSIVLDWYRASPTAWTFSLEGASEAIQQARGQSR